MAKQTKEVSFKKWVFGRGKLIGFSVEHTVPSALVTYFLATCGVDGQGQEGNNCAINQNAAYAHFSSKIILNATIHVRIMDLKLWSLEQLKGLQRFRVGQDPEAGEIFIHKLGKIW